MRAPVVIVGGGISGLAAATRLQAHGIPIAILEAKRRLGGRILKRLRAIGLDLLSKIFSERRGGIESKLMAVHAHKWAHDPHILVAYSYVPVNGLDLPKVLSAPRDSTLFFAGEATVHGAQTGTVFGALESGLRAADEIIRDQPG